MRDSEVMIAGRFNRQVYPQLAQSQKMMSAAESVTVKEDEPLLQSPVLLPVESQSHRILSKLDVGRPDGSTGGRVSLQNPLGLQFLELLPEQRYSFASSAGSM